MLTRNQDVTIMRDKVFDDLLGAVHDIDVPPVNPGVLGFQCRGEEIVSGLSHRLPSRSLRGKAVSGLDVHVHGLAEVLLHNHDAVERNLVGPLLYPVQFRCQNGQGVIGGVANQETKVDEIMRICELGKEIEVLDEIGCGVTQGCKDKNTFSVAHSSRSRDDGIEINTFNGGGVDLVGLMVVEEYRGL